MADKRNWFQKFFDQTAFGYQYVIQISPEQANKALEILETPKRDTRTQEIIEALHFGLNSITKVNGQSVVTIKLDTSNTIRLKDTIGITKENIHSYIEDNGFVSTETTYPK